ncbi:adenylate/guanylate cyclase domain-containing protein [Phaeobacter sp. B1627]|uniref:adenylate/guanylate cyclase domain-containing protein n=1 Tax=Phaeobacter sp. B1627 TaxID=2583809 RepID=UPI001119EC04|nr:adenylate/guanylate cyclase domain-containing protein [Phaeobacter sp. B1627]TNJ43371.1 adenylate/guanylate cyclase domain-containing protein [Phaeobacter sp. B1627]
MTERITRKLTTILAADAEQFSTAMTADEVGTFTELQAARDVFFKLISRHGGRVANTAGDGLIADFPSVVEAVQCAIEVQQELAAKDTALSFRIGVHLGDVICDGEDLIGEGVNLAARLQTMAEPGGVLISQQVYDHVKNKLTIGFEYLGDRRPRNMPEDIPVYRIALGAPRRSKTAQVWQDPDPFSDAPTRVFDGAPPQAGPSSGRRARALFARNCDGRQRPLSFGRAGATLALIAAGLFIVDISTGRGFWSHWVLLVVAAQYGLRNADLLFGRSEILSLPVKLWVIAAFLLCINLFSWSGYAWSMWPIGALVIASLARRISSQPE